MARLLVSTVLLLTLILSVTYSAPIQNLKLKFRLSARDLPDKDDFGTSDPFVELFVTEDGSKQEVSLGKTSVLEDTENPDWGETFELEFKRDKRQRLILRLWDEDKLRDDDNLGQAYIDVADFVDKDQHLTVNLNKKGYVILDSVVPVPTSSTPNPSPAPVGKQTSPAPLTASSSSPNANAKLLTAQKLKFRLSARNIPSLDNIGQSDPFVEVLYTENGSTRQHRVGTTAIKHENPNPNWNDVFDFNFDPAKKQQWLFDVRDADDKESKSIGEVWVDVSDYVAKGQKTKVELTNKKGFLTIEAINNQGPVGVTTNKPTSPTPSPTPSSKPALETKKLRFSLSARGLEDKDIYGTSDPYVKVYVQRGSDPEVFLGNTKKFEDKEDVDFPDEYEIVYDPSVKTKFRFLVLDEDENRTDDVLGNVSADVGDYVKSGENLALKLPKGTLTITKAI